MRVPVAGNPALRMFGFGPVCADGFGIGYIIKDDNMQVPELLSFTSSFTSTKVQ